MRAKNGDRFAQLLTGDLSRYDGDESAADLALCNVLAFYTRDAAQIDRLFRQSELFRRKWESRRKDSTYGADTIAKAIRDCRDHYTPAIEIEIDDTDVDDQVDPDDQVDHSVWPTLSDDALIGLFADFVHDAQSLHRSGSRRLTGSRPR